MTNELEKTNGIQDVIERLPQEQRETLDLCQVLARSTLVPKDLRSVSNMFVFALTAQDFGMSMTQALRSVYVVNGRPSMSADAMKALVLESGKAEYMITRERTPDSVSVSTRRVGMPDGHEETVAFSMADAKRAGLNSATWKGYPIPMMEHRATAQLCRSVYPDVVLGMYTMDELVSQVDDTALDVTIVRPDVDSLPAGQLTADIKAEVDDIDARLAEV